MSFWTGNKVLVTGGTGFIGSHVVGRLLEHGAKVTATYRQPQFDRISEALSKAAYLKLIYADLTKLSDAIAVVHGQDIVLNLAGVVGGVTFNSANHGKLYRENVLIQAQVLEACQQHNVERLLMVSSACVYPRNAHIPTPETEGFFGLPEATNQGYGLAKRVGEQMAEAYAKQYGMKIAIARPFNCYGPRDKFGDDSSHVIGGLVSRAMRGDNPLVVWGDGTPTRSFIYVDDLARGLLDLTEHYAVCDPVNLGSDDEVSISDLADKIAQLAGFGAVTMFDKAKPLGQPRRACDTSKASEKIGFRAETSLEEGLRQTVSWYQAQGVLA